MRSIVKVVWSEETPKLKLATEEGYEYLDLKKGLELDYEVTDERRCVGYHPNRGAMEPCPEFREIDSGDQCQECRNRDIYTGWRTSNGTPDFEADYSVYLAQCGDRVKVGVTRSSRIQMRWMEQGADYASEIFENLSGEEALEKEKDISRKGIPERIRKDHKIEDADSRKLEKTLEKLELENKKIEKVSDGLECGKLVRKGRFPKPVKHVKGQIVSNGRIGMALTSGKTLVKTRQKGLEDF